MNNYGYQNEYDFIRLFNNKYLSELDNISQSFLKELFDDNIDNDEKIICWKNRMNQKTDIFIKYKNYIKNVSLKSGNNNSIHSEPIQEFKRYLEKLGIPYKIIDKYVSYHYGYMRDENDKIDINKPLSADEYKELYQSEIDIFNKYINKTRIIVDMIDRFIIRGRNSDYDIDVLVSGTVDNYIWILKHDLYDLILSNKRMDFSSPHVACLTIGPKKRNIDSYIKHNSERYVVVVRWNYINELINEFRNNKI